MHSTCTTPPHCTALRQLVMTSLTPWVFGRYAASRETAASAVLRGGAKDFRFPIYDFTSLPLTTNSTSLTLHRLFAGQARLGTKHPLLSAQRNDSRLSLTPRVRPCICMSQHPRSRDMWLNHIAPPSISIYQRSCPCLLPELTART